MILSSGRELLFAPEDPVRSRILSIIGDAKRTVDLQAYVLTLEDMIAALRELRRSGKDVRVIISGDDRPPRYERKNKTVLDRLQKESVHKLKEADIQVAVGLSQYDGIMHGKYGIVDNSVVFHGSYNFTNAAEFQHNTMCIEHEAEAIRPFIDNFEQHWKRLTKIGKPLHPVGV